MMDQRLLMHPHPNPPPQARERERSLLLSPLSRLRGERTSPGSSLSRLRGRVARSSERDGWGPVFIAAVIASAAKQSIEPQAGLLRRKRSSQ
jgi:hypothetical protein